MLATNIDRVSIMKGYRVGEVGLMAKMGVRGFKRGEKCLRTGVGVVTEQRVWPIVRGKWSLY